MPNRNLSSYQFSYGHESGMGYVEVHKKGKKKEGVVGQLYWNTNPESTQRVGHISSISVHPDHVRKGLATEMYSRAQKAAKRRGIPAPNTRVTRHYTPQGNAWRIAIEERYGQNTSRNNPSSGYGYGAS